jgi:tetratricopeptide (TPR) repeat protein
LFASAAAAVLVGVVLAYSNHFRNGFHFDDDHTIVENLYIRDLKWVPRYFIDASTFSALPSNRNYRPLVTLSLAIDYYLGGGLNLVAFHASQFLALLVTGLLLYWLCRALLDAGRPHPWNRYAALLGAGLFCIHTANTETVNYIIVRSDLFSTLWVVAAFVLYIRKPAWRRYYLYLVPMVLGTLCKIPALMFAPLLLVYLVLFEADLSGPELLTGRGARRALECGLRAVPAFVAAVVLWVALNKVQEAASGDTITGGERPYPTWDYLITQTTAYVHYLRLFFWPLGLQADTEQNTLSNVLDPHIVGSTLLLVALAYVAWRLSVRRETRVMTFGFAWFVLALVPTSSVIPLSQVVSEHRTFFPYVGLMLAVVAGVMTWVCGRREAAVRVRRGRYAVGVAVAAFVALGVGTYHRNQVWRSEETLWRDIAEKEPQSARAWNNYGLIFLETGQYERAREMFTRSVQLNPLYRVAQVNLGITEDRLGNREAAERHFKEGIRLFEGDPDAHHFYARWLLDQWRVEDAVREAERTVELAPQADKNRLLLLRAYAALGDTKRVCAYATETLELMPNNAEVKRYAKGCAAPATFDEEGVMNAGLRALYGRRDAAAAARSFRRVLDHNPAHFGATYQLAIALDQAGNPAEARQWWEKVLPMAESYKDEVTAAKARARLAGKEDTSNTQELMQAGLDALNKQHDPAAAIARFRAVLEINPTHYGATYQLAAALDAAGRKDEARAQWNQTLKMAESYKDEATAAKARARLGGQ